MSRTKKQHYIAQSLLKIFVNSDKLYETRIFEKRTYKTSVENSMCKKDSYEFILLKDNWLENFFANNIDGSTANLNRELLDMLESQDIELAKVYTKFFSGIHYYIVNYYKSIMSLVRLGISDSDVDNNTSISQMLSRILNKEYVKRLARIFYYGYKFAIIKSKNGNFIMCDQYIATCSERYKGKFTNISSRDIGIKDTIVLIPLSCNYYVIFFDKMPSKFLLKEDEINVLNDVQEKIINEVIYNNAFEKVIGTDSLILENLERKNTRHGDQVASIAYSNGKIITYKVKNEVFLTNEQYEFYEYYESLKWYNLKYKTCRVNDKCPCGSNKKYKKCCKNKVDECFSIFNNSHFNQNILINDNLGIEEPVLMPPPKNKEMKELFDELKTDIKRRENNESKK